MTQRVVIHRMRATHLRKSERGATLIEFAVTSIVFFLLIFGIAEFGRAIWLFGTVSHGAREGARYAMVRGSESGRLVSPTDVETYVRNRAPGLGNATVTTTWPAVACGSPPENPCKQYGSTVTVHVQVMFDPVVWFMPTIPLRTTSTMTIAF